MCDQVVNDIVITSFLYVGGIPEDDLEAVTFVQRNRLSQKLQHSQSNHIHHQCEINAKRCRNLNT